MSTSDHPVRPVSEQGGRSSELAVVHPRTGEVLDALDQQPTERLADWQLAMKDAESQLKAMRGALDDELRRRLVERDRKVLAVGDFEVRIEGGNESVWDADELEDVVRELIDAGTIDARDVTDVIRHETVVSRSNANRLLDRLTGRAADAVAACRTWRRKGPGYVRVDRTTWPTELND